MDVFGDLNPCAPGSNLGDGMIFFLFFNVFIFFCLCFVIIITVQICKFNITVSTQFLLLNYSLWRPGLQRLQRFDFTNAVASSIVLQIVVLTNFMKNNRTVRGAIYAR